MPAKFDPIQRARDFQRIGHPHKGRQLGGGIALSGGGGGGGSGKTVAIQVETLPPPESQTIGDLFIKRNNDADDTVNIGLTNSRGEPIIVALNTLGSGSLAPLLSQEFLVYPSMLNPWGVAQDTSGNFYVSSPDSQAVKKYSPVGAWMQTFIPTAGFYLGHFGPVFNALSLSNPGQVAIDSTGRVLIADTGNSRLLILTSAGVYSTSVTGLTGITGVAVDASDNIYAAYSSNLRSWTSALGARWTNNLGGPSLNHLTTDSTHVYGTYSAVGGPGQPHSVKKYLCSTGAGVISWGSTGAADGQFNTPIGIFYNASELYVVDSGNSRVQVFGLTGTFIRKWSLPATGGTGVVLSSGGSVLVGFDFAGVLGGFVWRYSTTGTFLDSIATAGIGGIGATTGNVLWASDTENLLMHKYDLDNPRFDPRGLRVDASGNVFVADYVGDVVLKFAAAGTVSLTIGASGSGDGQLNGPLDVVLDGAGKVYVADSLNSRIQRFTAAGAYDIKFGTAGAGDLQFNTPSGLAFDSTPNLWIVDSGNHRVQKVSPAGAFLATYGSSGNADGQFSLPTHVAFDPQWRLWITDTGNDRVQVFDASFAFLGKAGSTGSGTSDLDDPRALVFAASGIGYIADQQNLRLTRLFLPNPQFIVATQVTVPNNSLLLYDSALGAWVDKTTAQTQAALAQGLVHLNTTVFSAVTSVSVDDVFSATYDNYKVFLQIDAHATANAHTLFRFRVSGADDAAASSYAYALWSYTSGAISGAAGSAGATSIIVYFAATAATTTDLGADYTIYQPFSSSARSVINGHAFALRSGVDWTDQVIGGARGIDKSHTGFSIVSGSGNIAGVVRTYGIRNA